VRYCFYLITYYPCILFNQRDAAYTVFFIIISALHVSGGFSAHHQELIKLYVQPSGSSKQAWNILDVACTVLELLMMGTKPPETCTALTVVKNIV